MPRIAFSMNPHSRHLTTARFLLQSLWRHRPLISQLAHREVVGRYRGSLLGLAWSFFNPVLMLSVYTFVFSVVFKARWTTGGTALNESKTEFAMLLFVGMIVHGLFSEVVNRAPQLILNNQNYVKRVVFPLEVLPVVSMIAGVFHALVSLGVMLLAFLMFNGYLQWTAVFAPVVLLPFVILTIGFAWILASIGVFVRDVGQTIGLVTTVLMFLAPVFYPISALPAQFQPWMMFNPLTFIIVQMREVLIWGNVPDWTGLARYTLVACFVAWAGFAWFQKTRKGFADVL